MAHPIVYGPAGSTYVWSARLALAEKGVTHELVDVPFGTHREGCTCRASLSPRSPPSSMTVSRSTRRKRSCAMSTNVFLARR